MVPRPSERFVPSIRHAPGVHGGRVQRCHVRGRRDEREPGRVEPLLAAPALAADDHEIGADPVPAVHESGDLAGGHAVPVRERIEPHEGPVVVPDQVPLHRAPDRVRPVEDDDALPVRGGGFHGVRHGPDVGVVARADILDVEDERVEPLQHRRRRPPGGPVEAVDGDPSVRVGDLDQVLLDGVEAVLGGEERGERHSRQPGHHVARVPEGRVHRRRVRDQPDPEAPQQLPQRREPVEPRPDTGRVHGAKTMQTSDGAPGDRVEDSIDPSLRDHGHALESRRVRSQAIPVHSVLSVREARERLAEISRRTHSSGERILLEERGTPVAALVPPSDLEALQLLEDWLDGQDALDALAECRVTGGVRWEDVKRDLGQ